MRTIFEELLEINKAEIRIAENKPQHKDFLVSYRFVILDLSYKNNDKKRLLLDRLKIKAIIENDKIINFTEEKINKINKFVESDDLLNLQLAIEMINLK